MMGVSLKQQKHRNLDPTFLNSDVSTSQSQYIGTQICCYNNVDEENCASTTGRESELLLVLSQNDDRNGARGEAQARSVQK